MKDRRGGEEEKLDTQMKTSGKMSDNNAVCDLMHHSNAIFHPDCSSADRRTKGTTGRVGFLRGVRNGFLKAP